MKHDELDDKEKLDEVELLKETDEDRLSLLTRLLFFFFLAILLLLFGFDSDVGARRVPIKFVTFVRLPRHIYDL